MASWSLTQLAAQVTVVPAPETDVAETAPAVDEGAGGILLFGTAAPADLGSQLAALAQGAPAGVAPLVMTDEEGGEVQRMANVTGNIPWPRTMTATMTPDQVRSLALGVGRALRGVGVTMDLAPVLDLASGPGPDATHTDGPRSFSDDPATATTYGLAFAQGLQDGGVLPVVKHFPGEGSATANTDDAPASTPPLSVLESRDLLPFEAAIRSGLPAVMVGNASVPGLSAGPASLSSAVIQGLLERQLGFGGLVLTDSLSAAAIADAGYSVPEAAVTALAAGADLVLFGLPPSGSPATLAEQVTQAIAAGVADGSLTRGRLFQAVTAVLQAKHESVCPTGLGST